MFNQHLTQAKFGGETLVKNPELVELMLYLNRKTRKLSELTKTDYKDMLQNLFADKFISEIVTLPENRLFGKEDADKVTEVIPTSKDYHISGGFPGGSQYAVKRQTMEVTYPRRKGMFTGGHTDIKYNYNKDSKALYSFYKSDAKRKNKELNKEDFIKYAIKTLSSNLDHIVKEYGDKNAKMDIDGIKSKVAEVFTSYINDNFEKISK
jgi:hypothetical protein